MQRVGSYLYCLPQYSQARKAIWAGVNARTGRTRIDDAFPPEIVKRKDDKSMLLELISGSTVQLVGSDQPDSLVGGGIVGLVMSEAALSNPAAFSFLRPMLVETSGWSMHISSPRGKNHFYKLLESHRNNPKSFTTVLSALDTEVFTPEQLKAERHAYIAEHGVALGNSMLEQEYYCSFNAANIGAVWGAEMTKLKADGRYGPCGYDPRYPVSTAWDLGVADDNVILYFQTVGSQERLIDVTVGNDMGLDSYAKILASKPYHYSSHIAPHDIQNRDWGLGTSRMEQAAKLGIKFTRVPNTPKIDQISCAAQLINRMVVNSDLDLETGEPICGYAMEALEQYAFKWDETRKVSSNQPIHNWTSHVSDALQTYATHKAKDVGFARPQEAQIQYADPIYPRVSAIIARNGRQSGGLWG